MAGGALLIVLTGLGLQHPGWFGPAAAGPRAVAADPARANRLLRASPSLLEASDDGGRTWRELPLLRAPLVPVALVFAPADSGTVWLLGQTELLVSRDGGRVWTSVPLPGDIGPGAPPLDLAVTARGAPVVVTASGAWTSEDAGGGWRALWRLAPRGGDRVRRWVHDLHTGHWGIGAMPRVYDAGALLFLAVIITGLVLGRRRRSRRRNP